MTGRMGDFDRDTRVEGEKGRYGATLSREWEVWGPDGGYVSTIALRAAGAEAQIRRPVTFAAHYLSVARFAPVDLEVVCLRRGRRTESFRVSMRQEGRAILEALVWTAKELPGLEHDTTRPPEVPGPEELENLDTLQGGAPNHYAFWNNLEERPVCQLPWEKRPPGDPVVQTWIRFRTTGVYNDPFLDAARSLLLIDNMVWPAACGRGLQDRFYAPNLDVAAWFHRPSSDCEWLLVDAESPVGEAGLVGGSVRIWTSDMKLVASGGAQLFCLPAKPA